MKNVLEYLEASAEQYPDKIAVDDGIVQLSWQKLSETARRTGSALSSRIQHGRPVPVFMEKSADMLTVMLGVVYAGGFYVPVNPEQAPGRLKKILEKLEAETAVTLPGYRDMLRQAGFNGEILTPEELKTSEIDADKLKRIRKEAGDSDLLYCIFTSGSTGTPKGVAVSHRAVIDFIGHFTELFPVESRDRIGNQAPFDFDVSVKDIYSALSKGATLILIPRTLFTTPAYLMDYLAEKKVTVLIWAVSALCLLSSLRALAYRSLPDIRRVMFSGEAMPPAQLKLWQDALPQAEFVNLYGPTEITCNCTWYKLEKAYPEQERIPAGMPFPGRMVFLIDQSGDKILSPGISGEICVSGESLAAGYYRDQKETEARFRQMKLDGRVTRVYCTGDLGYFDEDGRLYFTGRKDFQIKCMGRRIELEEIENVMTAAPGIEESCCIYDNGHRQIIAYYVGGMETGEVRKQMKRELPSYMVPARFIRVDRMPLTRNGKKDRRRLAQMIGG